MGRFLETSKKRAPVALAISCRTFAVGDVILRWAGIAVDFSAGAVAGTVADVKYVHGAVVLVYSVDDAVGVQFLAEA